MSPVCANAQQNQFQWQLAKSPSDKPAKDARDRARILMRPIVARRKSDRPRICADLQPATTTRKAPKNNKSPLHDAYLGGYMMLVLDASLEFATLERRVNSIRT